MAKINFTKILKAIVDFFTRPVITDSIAPVEKKTDDHVEKIISIRKQAPIIKESIQDALPIFKIGVANYADDLNTKKVRQFIKDEFTGGKNGWDLQCTEYAQYKIQQLGITIEWPIDSGRDGGKWADIFKKYGPYKVLDDPKKFCAVSFKEHHGPHGHVAFVEDVFNGETIKISEANFIIGKDPAGEYCERVLPKSMWKDRYKGCFIDFLS